MTISPQSAVAAPTDELADEESLYRATMQLLDAPETASALGKAVLLAGTLVLSVLGLLWLGVPLLTLLLIVLVLLLHELGHYLGMRLFGYRDVRMFFIPFFGAAVSGRKYGVPVWQDAVVLLLGPLPGLALAAALQWLYDPAPGTELNALVWTLAFINAFNLLPVTPLDGGRLLNLLFFARQPYLAAGFQLLAGCALAAYAWLTSSWVLGFLGVVLLLGVSSTYREAMQGVRLRAENHELPDEIGRLGEAQRRLLFARAMERVSQDQRNPASLAAQFQAVYEHMMVRRPSFLTTVVFVALYLSGFAAGAVVVYGERPLAAAEAADWRGLSASIDGKHDAALAEYRKAVAIREAYVARHPTRPEGQYALSRSYANLAVRAPAAQRLDYLEKVVAIREKLVERAPSAVKWQYELSRAHESFAGYYRDSNPEQALLHVGKAIALWEGAMAKDWRGQLGGWWSYERDPIGDKSDLARLHVDAGGLLTRLAQPREAVKHYRAALSIDATIGSNQNVLAIDHDVLGVALAAAGDRAEAVEHLRKAVSLYRQAIAVGGSFVRGTMWQLDRAVAALGPILLDLGRESEAVDAYREALTASETYASVIERKEASEKAGKAGPETARALEYVSKWALFARDFVKALSAAERSLSLAPGQLWVELNRAHALLLLGRADEAKAAYLARKGQKMDTDKTWEQAVAGDFASLRHAGLTHAMMPEILKPLGTGEQQ